MQFLRFELWNQIDLKFKSQRALSKYPFNIQKFKEEKRIYNVTTIAGSRIGLYYLKFLSRDLSAE